VGAQELLRLADAGLLLALLLARGVVAAVLLEVALFAAGVDLSCDNRAVGDQLVESLLEPVVGFLGQPGRLGVRHGHHSSGLSGSMWHTDHCARRHDRPGWAAPLEGGKAPSKEKHGPPAGRVVSTVTRVMPLVASFRRTVGCPREFPEPPSALVRPLHVHLRARRGAPTAALGDRSS